ncbi:long-chain fatty acid transport protein 4-like isoform X1 [Diorhabda sublineata]|uniref:long-chain fatty acid transport protein 4-like isoform X1 n=2 Tax=Diorhabda sublineata TaxID=1163346 RepID=UPI0024E12348|nr:long-chain fatty acid transport protein 4-like isoform X1 [Diorhabda sublineata]
MLKQMFGYLICMIPVILIWFFMKENRYKYLYILRKTWRRDLRGILMVLKAFARIGISEIKKETVPKIFTRIANKTPDKVAIYFENETWTFRQLDDYSNRIANYFISIGYKKGDTVALLLENRPEYAAIWMGLAKLGVITALINTNLISKPLYHCISVAKVKALIFGSDFSNVVYDIFPNSQDGIQLFQLNTSKNDDVQIRDDKILDLQHCISNQSTSSPEIEINLTNPKDKLLYIYTSGTTGLPKAAKITNARFNFAVTGIHYFVSFEDNDVFYNPLPLYHATGGMLTIGQCLLFGVTVALRKKFSASHFWTDCVLYNCTIANYIGETCRYILAANKGENDVKHGIKKMFGNGLKKDVWIDFVKTFKIPQIIEFYGSTEGNTNLINLDNTPGAVGFLPFYLAPIFSILLIKYDEETKQPIRNENGHCIKCEPGRPGVLIGRIHEKISTHNFDGYVDAKETVKKILKDVFRKGDSYFNSGDLMVQDEFGYFYFKDRTGDTYRWKGENVATTEVELVISDIIGPKDVVVYGVEVPKNEGKAGMIGIADKNRTVDKKTLAEGLKSQLPAYAVPLFLRIMDSVPLTGTFKMKKTDLQREGFDINVIKDPLYVYDNKKVDYVPIQKFYLDIINGTVKL